MDRLTKAQMDLLRRVGPVIGRAIQNRARKRKFFRTYRLRPPFVAGRAALAEAEGKGGGNG